MTKGIRISILCENQAKMGFMDKPFLAQHGFSVFIDADIRILFDTGATDVYLHNAKLFGIDLRSADWITISHGHWDHADGLRAFPSKASQKQNLLLHPGAFADRRKATGEFNGMCYNRMQMAERFNLIESKTPYRLTDRIWFLGEIPRENDFEAKTTAFYSMNGGEKTPDFIADDTALAVETERGLSIITGCSHAGVCNIVEYAKKITRQSTVHTVIGGFHLLGGGSQLEKTIEYFKENKVAHLYPMHCTDLAALSSFHRFFGIQKLCAGDRITLESR